MSKLLKVRKLGLAAYIKLQGCKLVEVNEKEFVFESERSLQDWSLEYSNSCCIQHDREVCELRDLLST